MALFHYVFPVSALILKLKSKRGIGLIPALARMLYRKADRALVRPDAVVAMPLHWRRLRQRGFNQSYEIAKVLCGLWQVPLDADFCYRTRDTAPQQGLNHNARQENVRGAFAVKARHRRYQHLLLLDDVITTGSSINALASCVKKAGVQQVDAICLAKTLL